MPLRIERPDQDEEWKGESARAGDTWTGPRNASKRALYDSAIRWSMEGGLLPDFLKKPSLALRNLHAWTRCFPHFMGENQIPATDDADDDMADQYCPVTRKTEFPACGDGHHSTKTSCSGICEEKTPDAEKKVQWRKDEDDGQGSARDSLKLDKEEKLGPAVDEGGVHIQPQGTKTCTELSPAAATSITEGECHAANFEGNHGSHGKRRTKRRRLASEYARNRTYRSAAAERHKLVPAVLFSLIWTAVKGSKEVVQAAMSWSLIALRPFIIKLFRTGAGSGTVGVVLGVMVLAMVMPSLAGAESIRTEVELDKSKAALMCPQPANAIATNQGITIKRYSIPDSAGDINNTAQEGETMIYCSKKDDPGDCPHDSCTVEKWTNQSIEFTCPKDMLQNGTFKLQGRNSFILCSVNNSTDTGGGQNPTTALIGGIVGGVVVVIIIIIVAIVAYKRSTTDWERTGARCLWKRSEKKPVAEGVAMIV